MGVIIRRLWTSDQDLTSNLQVDLISYELYRGEQESTTYGNSRGVQKIRIDIKLIGRSHRELELFFNRN